MMNSDLKNTSNKEKIFIAKASLSSIVFSYLVLLFMFWVLAKDYYSYFSDTEKDFFALLKNIPFDWKIWFLFILALLMFLGTNFNKVYFLENVIGEKKWYWKTKYYLYSEILEIRRNYGSEDKSITIFLNNGKNFEIPQYLLEPTTVSPSWGGDLIKFLKQKINKNVLIK